MARPGSSQRKMHRLAKRRWEHALEYWRPQNDMYGRLLAFCLDLEHYLHSEGFSKDRRRIQPRTQKQLNLIRHKAATILRTAVEFDGRAVQPNSAAAAAEISLRLVNQLFQDPLRAYHDVRSRFVWSALAGGRGTAAVDWHPDYGVVHRFVDPRRFHITPGHVFLHSPLTPYCIEEVPMRMSEVTAQSQWSVPRDLNPDNWKPSYATGSQRDDNLVDFSSGPSPAIPGADDEDSEDGIVTVLKTWYRDDPFATERDRASSRDLPPEEWYFVDDATGLQQPFDPAAPEPPMSEATGAPLRLVTSSAEHYDPSEAKAGYLCITAPFYAGEATLFEGEWLAGRINPKATLACFPYAEMGCYTHPLRRQGISDTEATRTLVVVDNSSYRATFEQMRQTGGILATEIGTLEDSEGNEFQVTDDVISRAYARDRAALEGIKFFQAPGMNPAMPQFRGMVNDSWQSIGTGDFSSSLGPERSKDIAASTVTQLQQNGDLPVQLHQKDLNHAESMLARAALDLCRAYMGDSVVSWVSDAGDSMYATVRADDLVPLHVTVMAGKDWQQQDMDRVQAQAQFIGMVGKLGLPPPAMLALLREAKLSPSVMDAVEAGMQPPPMMPGGGVPGGNVPPNAAPPMQ